MEQGSEEHERLKRWISYMFYDVVNSKSFFHDFTIVL